MNITNRDKGILIGLYLSKFDFEGLKSLGFNGFSEAYNTLGFAIGVKPASLKNYRDEFDPLFPNQRMGRRNRKIRNYCKEYYEKYKDYDLSLFTELLKRIVYSDYQLESIAEKTEGNNEVIFGKRLLTGQAAEQYFKAVYRQIPIFQNWELEDTTKLGCGFDFKLYSGLTDKILGVEVKGLHNLTGNVSLTEKEYAVAQYLKEDYFLFVVRNFADKPNHVFYQNPCNNSNLVFRRVATQVVQITHSTNIK